MSSAIKVPSLILAALLLVACGQAQSEPTQVPPPPTPLPPPTAAAVIEQQPTTTAPLAEPAEIVLTITGPKRTVSLTMAELQAMPAIEGWGGLKSSTGRITVPAVYTGVALTDLLTLVGDIEETAGISVIAEDGYAMTLAYAQVAGGDFVAYDPGAGDETDPDEQLTAALAYSVDGHPPP